MESIAKLIMSSGGTEKVARLVSFSSLGLAGISKQGSLIQKRFGIIAKQVSAARCTFRLFLDIPVFIGNKRYGLGKQEKDLFVRVLTLLGNFVDQLFFPLEHIAWACDCGIFQFNSMKFWTASIVCWAISLLCGIFKSIIDLFKVIAEDDKLKNENIKNKEKHRELCFKKNIAKLNVLKNIADFINAVHWLPPDSILWAGKLPMKYVGLLGTISSILNIFLFKYQAANSK